MGSPTNSVERDPQRNDPIQRLADQANALQANNHAGIPGNHQGRWVDVQGG